MKKILKIVLTITVLAGLSGNIGAQQVQKKWQWVNQLGGISWERTTGVAYDGKNNLYIAGSYLKKLSAGTLDVESAGNRDIFLARYDENGNLEDLWNAGGEGNDQTTCLSLSKDKQVILGGLISNKVTFNNISDTAKGTRLFVTSMNNKGKCEWITTFLHESDASLFLLDTDHEGNIYAAGVFSDNLSSGNTILNSNGKKDIFVIILNASGMVKNMVSFGGTQDDIPTALSVSKTGKIMLAGTNGAHFLIGNTDIVAATKKNQPNAFLLQFDNKLELTWKKQYTGENFIQITSIKQDNQENIYTAGSFNYSIFTEDTVITSKGYTDGFIMKYAPDGNRLWSRSYGTWYYDYAGELIPDRAGGMLITGSIGDTLVIDSLAINPLSGRNSACAIQFAADGQAIWADGISGTGYSYSNSAVMDNNGNLFITGTFRNTFEKENHKLLSRGDQDVFLAKYFICPDGAGTITGDPYFCPGQYTQLSVSKEYSNIAWNNAATDEHVLMVDKPGTYWVTMTDKRGCLLSDTLEVTMAEPSYFSLGDDTNLPVDSSLLLQAPSSFTNYMWQDNSIGVSYLAQADNGEPGTYTYWLSASDSLGCSVSDTIQINFYATQMWIDPLAVQLTTYPNPVNDWLYWSINTDRSCRFVVELTDNHGSLILSEYIGQYLPGTTQKINFSDLPYGSYFFRIKNGAGQSSPVVTIVKK